MLRLENSDAVLTNRVVRKTMCILSSCLLVVGFALISSSSWPSHPPKVNLFEVFVGSSPSSGRALTRCLTWMKPTSPLATTRCCRFSRASLPWNSRRGRLTLEGFHVGFFQGASVQWEFQGGAPWGVLLFRVPWVLPPPGSAGICLAAHGLKEPHGSACRELGREAMVAIREVEVSGAMRSGFLCHVGPPPWCSPAVPSHPGHAMGSAWRPTRPRAPSSACPSPLVGQRVWPQVALPEVVLPYLGPLVFNRAKSQGWSGGLSNWTQTGYKRGLLEPKCPVDILVQHSTHMTCNRKLNARIKCM